MLNFENVKKFDTWKNQWEDKKSMTLSQYISFNIHPEDLLIIGSLLLPKIIEVDECILLADNFEKDIYKNLCLKLDSQSVEKEINRVHVYDIFANCTDDVEDTVFERVGKLLQASWLNYFCREFSDKRIIVDYINDNQEYGPVLTMYQESS